MTFHYFSTVTGDSLTFSADMAFTTEDQDNDTAEYNRAVSNNSGWWFANCYIASLNAKYQLSGEQDQEWYGIIWMSWKGNKYSLRRTEMKLRPYGM